MADVEQKISQLFLNNADLHGGDFYVDFLASPAETGGNQLELVSVLTGAIKCALEGVLHSCTYCN